MTQGDSEPNEHGFSGYPRTSGGVGVRNHVLVLGINGLAMRAAERIAQPCLGAVCVATPTGRGHLGADYDVQFAHFIGLGSNPNVAAVLVVGADDATTQQVAGAIAATGKPVETVSYDEADEDSLRVIELGWRRLAGLIKSCSGQQRAPCTTSDLVVGVECGHSDTTSGIVSNPVVGAAVDRLVRAGATVIMGETIEWLGAEHLLVARARDQKTAEAIGAAVGRREETARASGMDLIGHNPGKENIRGGLTTIEEKALGAVVKSGTCPIDGLVSIGQRPPDRGLYLMDGPSFSPESMTGFVAAGAQVILFTTGLGNASSSLIAPTIKLTARRATVARLPEQIDFDAGDAWTGGESREAAADRLVDEILAVAGGRLTWGEVLGEGMETITRLGPTI